MKTPVSLPSQEEQFYCPRCCSPVQEGEMTLVTADQEEQEYTVTDVTVLAGEDRDSTYDYYELDHDIYACTSCGTQFVLL